MKDASKQRRSLGKLGILAAALVILPLTATIAPAVGAQNEQAIESEKPQIIEKQVKIIKINRDGKTVNIIGDDGDDEEVTKVERDGKTFIFRTDKKLSQAEVEEMIKEAEKSREEADDAMVRADEARGEAEAARGEAEAERSNAAARGHAEAMRVHAVAMAANYIPEIDIREVTKNCREGHPVTTNVEGFDGTNKARIKIVMCGKGQAKLARLEALQGLREARSEIASEEDIPEGIRKDVMEKLEKQIRKLEAEADKAS